MPAVLTQVGRALLGEIWGRVDPRLREQLEREFDAAPDDAWVPGPRRIVLVGQRAAGKSWLLDPVARWAGLPGHDLDAVIEAASGRRIADWFSSDAAAFRAAERRHFEALPSPAVIAAGGGFLALHADLLAAEVAVLVPLSFETYAARLRADGLRPRLRPELSLEEELRVVFAEREQLHARVPTLRLPAFLKATLGRVGQPR